MSPAAPCDPTRPVDEDVTLDPLPPGGPEAAAVDDPWPELGPEWEVVGRLGAGGMAEVFQVRSSHPDFPEVQLAAKVLRRNGDAGGGLDLVPPERIVRLREEYLAGLLIEHPAFVRVHARGSTSDGRPYLLLELLHGRDFSQLRRQQLAAGASGLDLATLVRLFTPVAEGLDFAHAQGLVHRDIKPSNLFLIEPPGLDTAGPVQVRILDLGIAGRVGSGRSAPPGSPCASPGTPGFMGPDQQQGKPASPAMDLWGLASCIRLLLGIDCSPADERRLAEPLRSAALVCHRAMGERSPERFDSAVAFLAALRALLDPPVPETSAARTSSPEPVAPAPPPAALAAPRPRRRWLFPGLALTLALASILVPAVWLRTTGAGPARGDASESRAGSPRRPFVTPAAPRLVVLPASYGAPLADDPVHKRLAPLLPAMVINALAPDERLLGRLERIDPERLPTPVGPGVDPWRSNRGARPEAPLTPRSREQGLELARTLGANLALALRLERRDGLVRAQAELLDLAGTGPVQFTVEAVRLPELAQRLAQALRRVLWPADPAGRQLVAPGREAALLLGRPESLLRWAQAELGDATTGELSWSVSQQLRQRLRQDDPLALAVEWERFLREPTEKGALEALQAASAGLPDRPLAGFFDGLTRGGPCDLPRAEELGRRHPLVLGPLAPAVCLWRGQQPEASQRWVIAAFDELPLRPQAAPLLSALVRRSGDPHWQLGHRSRIVRLLPERPLHWSLLATTLARLGRPVQADEALQVAEALLTPASDPGDRYLVTYHGALAQLATLDPEGAWDWLQRLEKLEPPRRQRHEPYLLRSLVRGMAGRYAEALAALQECIDRFSGDEGFGFGLCTAGYVHLAAALGQADEAQRALDGLEAYLQRFSGALDAASLAQEVYAGGVMQLAVDQARAARPTPELQRRLAALARTARSGGSPLDPKEQGAQEALILAQAGARSACQALVWQFQRQSTQLGGCRLRLAELELAAGRPGDAAAEFRRATDEIVWGRFLYVSLLPAAMYGEARALEALGQRQAAIGRYRQLVEVLRSADRGIPEIEQARQRLVLLEGAR